MQSLRLGMRRIAVGGGARRVEHLRLRLSEVTCGRFHDIIGRMAILKSGALFVFKWNELSVQLCEPAAIFTIKVAPVTASFAAT